jgi:hypothetical protein
MEFRIWVETRLTGRILDRQWVVKKLSDLAMSELRRIKDSTVLLLNFAVKTLVINVKDPDHQS